MMDDIERNNVLTPTAEGELQNFLQVVDEINAVVQGMSSEDPVEAEKATMKADMILHHKLGEFSEEDCTVVVNKSGINRKAFEAGPQKQGDPDEMNPEVFMAHLEKDANERAQDKNGRKEISERHKQIANKAFREQNYEKAMTHYNLAIEQIKDSGVLYTNRALTCILVGIYGRAISDCVWALKLNENNLKAWLYKAKSHHYLGEEEEATRCLEEAITRHPEHKKFIEEFKSLWESPIESTSNEN